MSSNSIADLIGGKDDDTANVPDPSETIQGPDFVDNIHLNDVEEVADGEIGGNSDPLANLWMTDFDLANQIFTYVSFSKVAFVTFMYVVWYLFGTRITSYYHFTWLSALLVVYISDLPVIYTYYLMTEVKDP